MYTNAAFRDEQEFPFVGTWIPAHVYEEQSLSLRQKILLVLIYFNEDMDYGKCSDSNRFFARRLGVSENIVKKELKLFAKNGWIEITFDGDVRLIELHPQVKGFLK